MVISKDKKEFSKNFIWNALGTGLNSCNSLFFLIIVTRINGTEQAGMFSIGIAIGLILYTIALYSGRVCHVTNINSKITDKDYILSRSITCVIMMILAIAIVILRRYSMIKAEIVLLICLFKCLEAFSDIFYGIMQKQDYLFKSGQSLFFKAIIGIIAFGLVDYLTYDLVLALIILNIVNIVILLFHDIKFVEMIKEGNLIKEVSTKQNILDIFKKEFFVFANSFAGIYILNASKYALDIYETETVQAIFGYIMMPATVMILFAQFLLLPFLNKFKKLFEENKIREFDRLGIKIKISVFIFGIFAVLIAFLIGPEFLSFIYGVDLISYRVYLMIIISTYILYSISYINLVILTTMRKTFIQFVVYLISILIAFITSNFFVKEYGIFGATVSIALTLTVQFVLYIMITKMIILKTIKKVEASK